MAKLIRIAKTQPSNPFAAMIINDKDGKVLCQSLNNAAHNPIMHGEIATINSCVEKWKQNQFPNTTLITTAEPCPMCMSAIMWSGIPHVIFGSSMQTLKHNNWYTIDIPTKALISKAPFYHGHIEGGLLEKQTDQLFKH